MKNTELIKEIEEKAKELGLEIESYRVKDSRYNYEAVEALHTDNCKFIDFGVCADDDEQIADWKVVPYEDYNSTICANSDEVQDEDVIVVVITSK